MAKATDRDGTPREPTDFGDREYPVAAVSITNACNLDCVHCFVFRKDNPNSPRDKMDDATMLYQLRRLRDRHRIKSMYLLGGEPMIRKELTLDAARLFERSTIVTNGTYGIPSLPGHVVAVSLDGPEEENDALRGAGVFRKVEKAVFARARNDGTTVIVQITVTRQNEHCIERFVEQVKDWPVEGIAFTFYVPAANDTSERAWPSLSDRDGVVRRVIALKEKYPARIAAHRGALELMLSDVAMKYTGERGENCLLLGAALPLYMGEGGNFERAFCCYGNDVDCRGCGTYLVFNAAWQKMRGGGRSWLWTMQ